jgi:NAD(P)H-dependent FMN reductase
MKQVLLINGSPAEQSSTGVLLKYLEGLFVASEFHTKFINLNELQLPYNNPAYDKDASQSDIDKVREFSSDVADSSVIVLGTPLYHGSFSGTLKLALDNLERWAFKGKTVLLCSNSSKPYGAAQAANELVIVGRNLRGDVFNRIIGTSKQDYQEVNGTKSLSSQDIIERCKIIVSQITDELR